MILINLLNREIWSQGFWLLLFLKMDPAPTVTKQISIRGSWSASLVAVFLNNLLFSDSGLHELQLWVQPQPNVPGSHAPHYPWYSISFKFSTQPSQFSPEPFLLLFDCTVIQLKTVLILLSHFEERFSCIFGWISWISISGYSTCFVRYSAG